MDICRTASLMVVSVLAPIATAGTIVRVDDDAPPGGDGATWETAFRFLQDALAIPDVPIEIRVAQGVYTPHRSEASPDGTRDRAAQFDVGGAADDVVVLGGFAGLGAKSPDARDPKAYETILSGDLLGNDAPDFTGNGENSYRVVYIAQNGRVDGFTITGGNADGFGGMGRGAAVRVASETAMITDCTLIANSALRGGAMALGAVDCAGGPPIASCRFIGNRAEVQGGAVFLSRRAPLRFIDCSFIDNAAPEGDVVYMFQLCGAAFVNCVFSQPFPTDDGAIHMQSSSAQFINCTFNAMAVGITLDGGDPTVRNSVLGSILPFSGTGTPTVVYSSTVLPHAGVGNITGFPHFVDEFGADGIRGTPDDDLRVRPGSPTIDAGSNSLVPAGVIADLDGLPRFADDPCRPDTGAGLPPVVDMGAYEFQQSSCDIDRDGAVGTSDLLALLAAWGPCGDCDECPGDFDDDCRVGTSDLLTLLAQWG